nr:hypothetical protein CFP56_06458 [Quercus suber]
MTDDTWLSHKATWYESFGDADRVYEGTGDRYNPYPILLINTETEDTVIRDPLWLSEMIEAGFISKLIITSVIQISLLPKVIHEAAAQIGGLNYMKMPDRAADHDDHAFVVRVSYAGFSEPGRPHRGDQRLSQGEVFALHGDDERFEAEDEFGLGFGASW